MKITFLQSGGFAGTCEGAGSMRRRCPRRSGRGSSSSWPAAASRTPARLPRRVGRDRRRYDLAIDQAGQVVRLSCDEASVPQRARPLLAFLTSRATPQGLHFTLPAPGTNGSPAPAALPRSALPPGNDDANGEGRWGRFEGRGGRPLGRRWPRR